MPASPVATSVAYWATFISYTQHLKKVPFCFFKQHVLTVA